ncbi:uncharacterized protein [Atheta coriaria]|uniref:uncharacterized protein n=1 Tax=Dalotia coriaria TaxID=877792 RepID=UPI0031F3DF54
MNAKCGGVKASFINVCKRNSDSDALKCVLDNVERCREHLAKGIPRLVIPPMDPLIVPSLDIIGHNLNINLKNLNVHNLLALNVAGGDLKLGHSLVLNLTVPYVFTKFQYEADGKLLGLVFKGDGDGYVNASDVTINIEAKSHPVHRNQQTYLDIDYIHVEYKAKTGMINIENLFKKQDELNAATNKLINDNFNAFDNEIAPDIAKSISALIESIARNLFEKFSYDEMFPEN